MFRKLLSKDTKLHTFSFLSSQDLLQVNLVDHEFKKTLTYEDFWRLKLENEFCAKVPVGKSAKETYLQVSQRATAELKLFSLYSNYLALVADSEEQKKPVYADDIRKARPNLTEAEVLELAQDDCLNSVTDRLNEFDKKFKHIQSPTDLEKIIKEEFPKEFNKMQESKEDDLNDSNESIEKAFSEISHELESTKSVSDLKTNRKLIWFVETLCKCDAHVTLKVILNKFPGFKNLDLLYTACDFLRLNTIKLLVEIKVDVNKLTNKYRKYTADRLTPLAIALDPRNKDATTMKLLKEITQFLLANGANINSKVFGTENGLEFDRLEELCDQSGRTLLEVCQLQREALVDGSDPLTLTGELKSQFIEILSMVIDSQKLQQSQTLEATELKNNSEETKHTLKI